MSSLSWIKLLHLFYQILFRKKTSLYVEFTFIIENIFRDQYFVNLLYDLLLDIKI